MNNSPETPNTQLASQAQTTPNSEPPTGPVPDPTPESRSSPEAAVVSEPQAVPVEGAVEPPAALTLADLTIPEGVTIPEDLAPGFLALFANDKTPAERANAALAMFAAQTQTAVTRAAEEYAAQWTALENQWKQQIQTAYPGEKMTQALDKISKVLDAYGNKETREAFTATGAGNNPAIFEFLHKIALDYGEKPPVKGSPAAAAPGDLASRMYPQKG